MLDNLKREADDLARKNQKLESLRDDAEKLPVVLD